MTGKRHLTENEIIASHDLFKMTKADALEEIVHQLRVIRLYTMTKSRAFLDYLVRMAEMEARREAGEHSTQH